MKSVSIFPGQRPEIKFPITEHLSRIYATIGNRALPPSQRRNIIVSSPTGTGKTLGIPLSFATRQPKAFVRVAVPTTIAAKHARDFISTNTNISVGYATGGRREYSNTDRIVYMTAGYMVNRLLWIIKNEKWNELVYVIGHMLIIDEAHSASKDISVLFGLVRYLEDKIKPIVIITSATGSGNALEYFPDPSFITITQAAFPVEVVYENIATLTATRDGLNSVIARLCKEERERGSKIGIIFRPGRREVSDTIVYLLANLNNRDLKILPAVSGADIADLNANFNGFKLIVGTNYIESSVTINNADFVIDDLLEKMPVKSLAGGKKLQLSLISKSSLEQRAGRVGRTKPGRVYRLIPRNEYNLLPDNTTPEILRVPIDDIVLKFIKAGLNASDVLHIPLRDYLIARNNLLGLGMIDANGITAKGEFASELNLSSQNTSIIHYALTQLKYDKSIGTFLAVKSAVAVAVMLEMYNGGYFWRPFKKNGETKEEYAKRQAVATEKQAPLIGVNDIDTLLTMFWNFMQFRAFAFIRGNKPLWAITAEWSDMYSINNVRWKRMLSLFRVINQKMYSFSSYYERLDTMSLGIPLGDQLNPILQRIYPGIKASYAKNKLRKLSPTTYVNDITGALYNIRERRNDLDSIYALEILQLSRVRYATLFLPDDAGNEEEFVIEETKIIELDEEDLESALDEILGFNDAFEDDVNRANEADPELVTPAPEGLAIEVLEEPEEPELLEMFIEEIE